MVQVGKKIEANDFRLVIEFGSESTFHFSVQVGELWRQGEKYSCGYVGEKTKVNGT